MEEEQGLVIQCIEVDTEKDDAKVHPSQVCYPCLSKMKCMNAAKSSTPFIQAKTTLFEWTPYTDEMTAIVCVPISEQHSVVSIPKK